MEKNFNLVTLTVKFDVWQIQKSKISVEKNIKINPLTCLLFLFGSVHLKFDVNAKGSYGFKVNLTGLNTLWICGCK
jgi:hypothetical protein